MKQKLTNKTILTVNGLKTMPDHAMFLSGITTDNPDGINMTGNGQELRWVAVRGCGYHDWAIYIHTADHDTDWIRVHGDKVLGVENIKKLVNCDEESFLLYRY